MSAREQPTPIELADEPAFTVGRLRVQPSTREVIDGGQRETLEPRVMQVLVALARRRGEVISRDRLVDECWAGRVVGDDAIGRCIAKVRRLSEAHGTFTLETIPRVGYRLTEEPPVPAATAPSAAEEVAQGRVPVSDEAGQSRQSPRANVAVAAGLVAAFAFAAGLGIWHWQRTEAARIEGERTLAHIAQLVQEDRYGAAFTAARALRQQGRFRDDPRLAELWSRIVSPMRPQVAEPGAALAFKPYDEPASDWIEAGTSPFQASIDAPLGTLRVKLTKPGFRTAYSVIANPGPSALPRILPPGMPAGIPLPIAREGAIGADMVLVPHTNVPVTLVGWSTDLMGSDRYDIPAFAIGRAEVTNREFKEFVDAGGYDDPQWWRGLTFEENGRELSWDEARTRFVDATHRPGPAGWQLSTYPKGADDQPVGGISWYEAVAYARFRGAMLPTIHHWVRAALSPYNARAMTSPSIALQSRFSADGPANAHSEMGLGPWGTYHMLGNVREWVWNRAGTNGLALGGAWSDYYGDAQLAHAAQPMWRLPQYGVRLMRLLPGTAVDPKLLEPTRRVFDSMNANRAPVSDDAFEAMRFQFTTHHVPPLEVQATKVDESPLWIAEEVVLKFAASDAMSLYVVRPKAHSKPLQPIVYGPPADCCYLRRPNRDMLEQLRFNEFIVQGGRALVMPVWRGSYETFVQLDSSPEVRADQERRAVLRWQQQLSSTLDYLGTRADMDVGHIGYLGVSQGAVYNGALNLALESRVRAAVLISGGVPLAHAEPLHPMIDIVNYAPRIKIPVLMLNGRFDHVFPYEQSQKRLFALLGSAPDKKSHVVLDTGHFAFAPNTIAMHATDWFDRYLAPVR
jgi:DNA-binding winged helix-turn-helix (wHTH) protein/predicted esterase